MESLYGYASERHGVFSREEARKYGYSDSAISRRVANGQFIRIGPSVFRVAGAPSTWRGNARSAALSTGGLLSHLAAAALHEIDGFCPGPIEVSVPKYRRPRGDGFTVHRTTQFGRAGATEIDGVPVTDLPRTVLDVAAVVSARRLEWTVDAVLRQELCEWSDLFDVWVRHSIQGRNGNGPLRLLLEERFGDTDIPDSRWNRMVGELLIDSGMFGLRYEYEILNQTGRVLGRVDIAFPNQKVAIELDSVRWHLNRKSFEADPRRKNSLAVEGWTVLTFTWADYARTPKLLIRTVRAALQPAA